jgi:malonyl-CoA decarboxylase
MNTSEWFSRKVARLISSSTPEKRKSDAEETKQATPPTEPMLADKPSRQRSIKERLASTLKNKDEALSPRLLRRTLRELHDVVDNQISEAEGGLRAQRLTDWYGIATQAQRRDFWLLMSEQFTANPETMKRAQLEFTRAVGTSDEAAAEVLYRRATVSPRRRLLQRFSAFSEGIRFLVDMRAEMLPQLKADKRLKALDVEMEYMFSTWFDVGFLELRRISWDSPASLIEKLIKYEAVHDIKSWADVKNRLDSDRRCYGFFHPRLPSEPLIFVEVALLDDISKSITPLLDESAVAEDVHQASTAIFYSISNTQQGLKGVSFGDSLIKKVVETLKAEFPRLKTFATLSPIPGFRAWFHKNATNMLALMEDKHRESLGLVLGAQAESAAQLLAAADSPLALEPQSPVRQFLLQSAAYYLSKEMDGGKPADPVARFHLGNGARIERLNWGGDPSVKGIKQSYGMMVNYLYDLKRLDKHRTQMAMKKIPVSSTLDHLNFKKSL